jgi:hypothetical protein
MTAVLNELKAGNKEAAVKQMQLVETTLTAESEQMLYLMELISAVLKPSPYPEVPPESLIVLDILSLASDQKVLYRKTQTAQAKPGKDIAAEQLKLAKRCELLIKRTETFAPTFIAAQLSKLEGDELSARKNQLQALFSTNQAHIVQANKSIADAVGKLQSGAAKDAISIQHQANELLRYFLVAYIDGLLVVMPPAGPEDPVTTDATDPSMTDDMTMYMPGAVSGTKPKGGRQEWEVLGQRDRAALNENFARELPLEYRAVLKDYYERLAK